MKKIMISLFTIALLLVGCGSKTGENFEESNIQEFRQTNNDEVQSRLDDAIRYETFLDEDQATVYKSVELNELSDGEYYWLVDDLANWYDANYMQGANLPFFSDMVLDLKAISKELSTLAEENDIAKQEIK